MRRRWCGSGITISWLVTTSDEIAAAGIPACRRNACTAAASRRRRRAAPVALAASPRTVSDHLTRFALIGRFAEPVTTIVSWRWRASCTVAAKMCAVQTTATAMATSPRKSSGMAGNRDRRCTAADDLRARYGGGSAAVDVEPVDELVDRRAAHVRQATRAEEEPLERTVVRPAVPGLEVVAELERRAVAAVARLEGVPEAAVGLVLDSRCRLAGLVREEVVVHRDHVERVAGERDLRERHRPDPALAPRPGAEGRRPARVVAEAAPREHRIERGEVALEARRPLADDLARAQRQLVPAEEQAVELIQLAAPVGGRPLPHVAGEGRAEVAVEVRADLVSLAVAGRDLPQRSARVELAVGEAQGDFRASGPTNAFSATASHSDRSNCPSCRCPIDAAPQRPKARSGPSSSRPYSVSS